MKNIIKVVILFLILISIVSNVTANSDINIENTEKEIKSEIIIIDEEYKSISPILFITKLNYIMFARSEL
jgi:hypothetical protein